MMTDTPQVLRSIGAPTADGSPKSDRCVMVIFGASGDLTKRLLVPAIYNLACDGLLSDNFVLVGSARSEMTNEKFREQMSDDIKKFHTRQEFDQEVWDKLVSRFYYMPGGNDDLAYIQRLKTEVARLDSEYKTEGNVLFYFALAPRFFGPLCDNLYEAGFREGP